MAHSTDMAHALLGASSSHRWLHCTPSARLEEKIPNVSSVYADEGSLAHAWGAKRLKTALGLPTDAEEAEIRHYSGVAGRGQLAGASQLNSEQSELSEQSEHCRLLTANCPPPTTEMDGHVRRYVAMVWDAWQGALGRRGKGDVEPLLRVEQHVDYSPWVPEGFGTGDAVIVEKGRLTVVDLKYGKGVRVMAQDNPQLKLYALGALDIYDYVYDIEEVEVMICQPRLNHYDRWSLSRRALMEWAEGELREKAGKAWRGEGEAVAGTWCRFCRAKHHCGEWALRAFRL